MSTNLTNNTIDIVRGGDNVARSHDLTGSFRSQIGEVFAKVHPTQNTTIGSTNTIQFGLPFPRGECISVDDIKVFDSSLNELPTHIEVTSRWHNWDGNPLNFIRSVSVTTELHIPDTSVQDITIKYGQGGATTKLPPVSATATWINYRDSGIQYGFFDNVDAERRPAFDYDGTGYGMPLEVIMEPATWVTFEPVYIRQCEVFSPFVADVKDSSSEDMKFCFEYYKNTAKTMTNEVAAHVTEPSLTPYMVSASSDIGTYPEPNSFAAWLFDRSTSLYALYAITGELKWLQQGHRAAAFYSANLLDGYFTLKAEQDIKYSYGKPLLIDTILCGDSSVADPILDMTNILDSFNHDYHFVEGSVKFWTERHIGYKLGAYVSAWQHTGSQEFADKAKEIFDVIYRLQQTPENGWFKDGSLRHSINSHESFGGDVPIGSPWMSSLLANEIIIYYRDSGDTRALTVLADLADWVLNYATRDFLFSNQTIPHTVPWYLAGDTFGASDANPTYDDPWADLMHAYDVASLVSKGAWAKARLGLDNTDNVEQFNKLIRTAAHKFRDFHRTSDATIAVGKTLWRIQPSRSFNWWFTAGYDVVGIQERF